jgi:hypothetical protein
MYPSSIPESRSNRAFVSSELGSFYAGTEFRIFREFALSSGASAVIRLSRNVPIIIRGFYVNISSGEMEVEVFSGATPAGSWATKIPIFNKNNTGLVPLPKYETGAIALTGGTISGGTLIDKLFVKTSGSTAQASTIGVQLVDEYGAPAGEGYYKFTNSGNSTNSAIFHMWWEELPTP